MAEYDKDKLAALMDKQRELSAAYRAGSGDLLFYRRQYRDLLQIMEKGAKQSSFRRPNAERPYIDTDFVPLHEMKESDAIVKYKDHPSKGHVSIQAVRDFFQARYENNRIKAHQADISKRSQENLLLIQVCMDFLKSKGIPETDIPDE